MKNLEHVLPGLTMQSRAANGGFWKNCYFGALVVEEVLKNADHLSCLSRSSRVIHQQSLDRACRVHEETNDFLTRPQHNRITPSCQHA